MLSVTAFRHRVLRICWKSADRIYRAEASDLPIVHADPAYQAEQEDDHRGYFEDGAYTAAPELGPEYPDYYDEEDWDVPEDGDNTADGRSNHISHITPCEAFTNALLSRYRQLREVIQSQKADMVPGMPSDSTRLVVPRGMARRDKDIWKRKLLSETPQPSVLVTTSLSSISNLLVVAKDECLSRKQNIGKSVSLWFLALLASIDEATVDSDIMWELRDLAKKAIWLRIDFEPRFEAASDAMGQEAGYIKGTESSETNAPSSDRHNTSSVLASEVGPSTKQDEDGEILDDLLLDEDIPNDATKATLDMIVVIVGEVFGQRDLLESRTAVDWPALEEEVNGDEWAVDEDEDG